MFNRTIDEVMYKSQTNDLMFQLQRFMKVNPLKQLIDEKEKALLTRKNIALEKVRHLQGLLAWSCNSGSTAESIKMLNGEDIEQIKPNSSNIGETLEGLSKKRLAPTLNSKSNNLRMSQTNANSCSPLKLDKCQPNRNRVVKMMLSDGPTMSNCDMRTNRKSVDELKADSTKRLECVQQEEGTNREKEQEEGMDNAEIVAYKKPIIIQRTMRKSSVLPLLESKHSPSKQYPMQNVMQDRRYTNPSFAPSPIPKLPRGYLRFDVGCSSLLSSNLPLLIGRKYEECQVMPLPPLTAERVCVLDSNTLELIMSRAPDDNQDPIEIASLTKILTALLTILVCTKFNVDIKQYKCRVSEEAAFMPGTSAELQVGDVLTIESLLYGLMLPSGNDASVALAENVGRIILKNRKRQSKLTPYKLFVGHMNLLYQQVIKESSMPTDTFADSEDDEPCHRFQNPSGLSLYKNITKPEQIMLLAAVAYRNRTFREIVSTKEYGIVVRNERYGLERRLAWRNTNKLLWKGWEGIKTGTTENAGPCLIGKIDNYLIGVFNCGGHQKRFNEAILIHEILRKTI